MSGWFFYVPTERPVTTNTVERLKELEEIQEATVTLNY